MSTEITPKEREAYRLLYEAARKLKQAQQQAARKRKKATARPRKGKAVGDAK